MATVSKFSAPGKVILTGEHSVAHGKLAIAMAINLKCYATLTVDQLAESDLGRANTTLAFHSHFSEKLIFPNKEIFEIGERFYQHGSNDFTPPTVEQLAALKEFVEKFASKKFLNLAGQCFVHSLLCVLMKDEMTSQAKGFIKQSWVLEVKSEVPLGAGLGSSAAVNTVIAGCILDKFGMLTTEKANLDKFELKLAEKLAFASEHVVHGKPSGVDTFTSCHGNAIVFENFALRNLIELPLFDVLVIDTKEDRNTKLLVDRVRTLKETNFDKFERILNDIDVCSRSILELFVRLNSKNEVSRGDFRELSDLVKQNHVLLQEWGVSTEKLDKVVEVAEKHNCAGKLTGAGGGGCAIVILNPNLDHYATVELISEDLKHLDVEVFEVQISKNGLSRC
ncbi:uncharacterized protein LOC142345587 [Convolutriloba macropyga]|uniref:uncharacterized protein LOC142345587 n=1 Tax=Convolutriloba macropyga TaxID=536237 RepID=UPI003F51DC7C